MNKQRKDLKACNNHKAFDNKSQVYCINNESDDTKKHENACKHQKINKYALFFINSLEGGGAETVVKTLAWELNNQGIKSIFITLYGTHNSDDANNKNANANTKQSCKPYPSYMQVHCMNLTPSKSAIESVYYMQNIDKLLNKKQEWKVFLATFKNIEFNLVTAHLPLSHKVCSFTPWADDAIYVMHLSQYLVPYPFQKIHGKIIKNFYKGKKVSCVSNGVRDELINKYGFNPSYTKTIYNPIKNFDIKNTIEREKPFILMIGRLCKQKRQDIAIKLFIKGKFYKTHDLIILGEGPWRNKLEDIVNKHLQAKDSIYLPGHKANIEEWLAGASMLLSTSATEGFGMVIVEALEQKTPAISTDCDFGPNEILTGELANYLIPSVEKLEKSNAAQQKAIKIIQKTLSGNYPKITDEYIDKFCPDKIVCGYIDFYKG